MSDLRSAGERAAGLLRAAAGDDLPAAVLRVEDGRGETFSAPVGDAADQDAVSAQAPISHAPNGPRRQLVSISTETRA